MGVRDVHDVIALLSADTGCPSCVGRVEVGYDFEDNVVDEAGIRVSGRDELQDFVPDSSQSRCEGCPRRPP